MANFDDFKLGVEVASGGTNTVVLDDIGMPSIMVILPKMKSKDLFSGATDTTHPAWIVDGVEHDAVGFSKYANIIVNDRAYSLPLEDPRVSINWDAALAACRKKGEDWGLTPFILYSAVAQWCRVNKTIPHGNNNYGHDSAYPHEVGQPTAFESDGRVARTATGSGPATWYHDHTPAGIADLNGNTWDWLAGARLNNGEIQIIPYANCMKATCDMSLNSSEWKAITVDGRLVNPGTDGTLKLDYVDGKIQLCTKITTSEDAGKGCNFESLTKYTSIEAVPQIIRELTLFPETEGGYDGDYFYMNNVGERFPLRGGNWNNGANAGVFYSYFGDPRSDVGSNIGFRSAYYGKLRTAR